MYASVARAAKGVAVFAKAFVPSNGVMAHLVTLVCLFYAFVDISTSLTIIVQAVPGMAATLIASISVQTGHLTNFQGIVFTFIYVQALPGIWMFGKPSGTGSTVKASNDTALFQWGEVSAGLTFKTWVPGTSVHVHFTVLTLPAKVTHTFNTMKAVGKASVSRWNNACIVTRTMVAAPGTDKNLNSLGW